MKTFESLNQELGKNYMALALQYGQIELKKGLSLHSIDALEKEYPGKIRSFYDKEAFFLFQVGNRFSVCYDPEDVINHMEDFGRILPFSVSYNTSKEPA